MAPRLLILGRGFLGRHVAQAPPAPVLLLPHSAVHDDSLPHGIEAVLWAGRHPALGTAGWRLEDELELKAARLAARRNLPFLSLGTRKVYAPSSYPLDEDAEVGPVDRYGEQKLQIEEALLAILGDRLTRLRLANIFGDERGRTTFMGRMLTTLVEESEIRFDMSPFTRRDFMPVQHAGWAISTLLGSPPGGVVNVGSGVALECGRLAMWLMTAFDRGRLVCESWRETDEFVLAVDRLERLTGLTCGDAPRPWRLDGLCCGTAEIRSACFALGAAARPPISL